MTGGILPLLLYAFMAFMRTTSLLPYISLVNILIYIQQDATLHSLFYMETALHVSGGTSTHHQERIQLYLQHLVLVTPLLLPAAIAAGSRQQAADDGWRYHTKHVDQFPDINKLCKVASFWIHIGINYKLFSL